jgi:hypothetical protein
VTPDVTVLSPVALSEEKDVAGRFSSRPRRVAVFGAGLLLAGSAVVTGTTVGVASAAPDTSGKRPVSVTFDNRSSQLISACVFGSGGRCTNGGIAAGATAVVDDPFNSKQKVTVAVYETGTGRPDSVERTVTAAKKLCGTVTEDRNGPLKLSVKTGSC